MSTAGECDGAVVLQGSPTSLSPPDRNDTTLLSLRSEAYRHVCLSTQQRNTAPRTAAARQQQRHSLTASFHSLSHARRPTRPRLPTARTDLIERSARKARITRRMRSTRPLLMNVTPVRPPGQRVRRGRGRGGEGGGRGKEGEREKERAGDSS